MKQLLLLVFTLICCCASGRVSQEEWANYNETLDAEIKVLWPPLRLFFDADSESNKRLYAQNYDKFVADHKRANARRARWLNKLLDTTAYRVDRFGDLDSTDDNYMIRISPRKWIEFAVSDKALSYTQAMFRWASSDCLPAAVFEEATQTLMNTYPPGSVGAQTISKALAAFKEMLAGNFSDERRVILRDYMKAVRDRTN